MEMRERHTETLTLKEKLKVHYHQRDFQANKKDANKIGVVFFWVMTISLFIEAHAILIPRLYWGEWIKMGIMIALVWFTLFEAVINWMGVYFGNVNFADAELKKKNFPSLYDTPPGWTYCASCQIDAPPRSYHCQHCNACVLKRDHHCFFTNSCVGYYNQRFFVWFCVYMIWGNLFALYGQLTYLNQSIPIFSWEFVTYLPMVTIFKFLAGYLSFLQFFLITHAVFCAMCLIGAVFFFVFNLLFISHGFTSYEAWKVRRCYYGEKTVLDNFRSVFGSLRYIPLQLLYPFRVDQRGDGAMWNISREKYS